MSWIKAPFSCEPLCQVIPHGSPLRTVEAMKAVDSLEKSPKSKWVDNHMTFNKYVGFPIDEFEEECLALFRRIEECRNQQKRANMHRKTAKSGRKGTRELHNLVSFVNYERNQLCCR